MVVSSACMMVAAITQIVRNPRCGTSTVSSVMLRNRSSSRYRAAGAQRALHARVDGSVDAHAGAQLRRERGWSSASRTVRRCTTFTQLPDVFCAGRTENSDAEAGVIDATFAFHIWPE